MEVLRHGNTYQEIVEEIDRWYAEKLTENWMEDDLK